MSSEAAPLLLDEHARSAIVDLARSRELNVSRVYKANRSNPREAFEAVRADAEAKVFGAGLAHQKSINFDHLRNHGDTAPRS